ncbi:SIS domain-containing protein [Streptosporangium sp. NPDC000509]|uniref:SIS domain-containing protein n=1 Tax=Streptosporangium sp. NPDC000509 TaxID=3366186 RepID=UPI0036D1E0D6
MSGVREGTGIDEEAPVEYVLKEIADQPACWRQALDLGAASPAGLPETGERVAVIGCGTSLYMAQAYAVLRERSGQGETDAFPASELPARRYDRLVAITRSGTTTEVLRVLDAAGDVPTAAVTADPATPVTGLAKTVIALEFADERSVVQTRFATSALALLRAHLGEAPADLAAQAETALTTPLPEGAISRRQFTFLGSGWTNGLAQEAALKLREAALAWSEAYPAMEYRHGPISVADENSLVWFFGGQERLLDDVARTGALTTATTLDPLADLIRAQRLAVELARSRGLDPDNPRNLTRSVILG